MVQSQADAPLQWLPIRSDGSLDPHRDLDNEAWGVIEIGHYTTDFALSDRGTMMEYAAVSCPGMHLVYDGMSNVMSQEKLPTSLDVVEAAGRSGGIKLFGQRVDVSHLLAQAKAATSAGHGVDASISARKRSRHVSFFLLANSTSEKLDCFMICVQMRETTLCQPDRRLWAGI